MAKLWTVGEAAPYFTARTTNNPTFRFDTVAGRYIVLCFFGSAGLKKSRLALQFMLAQREFFNDVRASFFGVTIDPQDESSGRVRPMLPGFRFFWDMDKAISIAYGATSEATIEGEKVTYRPFTLVLDPALRVVAHIPLVDADQHNAAFTEVMTSLPELKSYAGVTVPAPVLLVPHVFEPEFCHQLVRYYSQNAPAPVAPVSAEGAKKTRKKTKAVVTSGEVVLDGRTDAESFRLGVQKRMVRHLLPEVAKRFCFDVTRIERYALQCYGTDIIAPVRHNRFNALPATAHRRFACLISLSDEYKGGGVRFPEFGTTIYDVPMGGALVFSSSMITEMLPMKDGGHYTLLPFLYDEVAAAQRERYMEEQNSKMRA